MSGYIETLAERDRLHDEKVREAIVRAAIAGMAGIAASVSTGYPVALAFMAEDIREIEGAIVGVLTRRNII